WCKGCKNFRLWEFFGEKGHATKCHRCRSRQRTQYVVKHGDGTGATASSRAAQLAAEAALAQEGAGKKAYTPHSFAPLPPPPSAPPAPGAPPPLSSSPTASALEDAALGLPGFAPPGSPPVTQRTKPGAGDAAMYAFLEPVSGSSGMSGHEAEKEGRKGRKGRGKRSSFR
ncbi:hypothetical protein TeGR_g12333, partial [Tetraparma gracilis]